MGLMATGQVEPIGGPLADVEQAPISHKTMQSVHKEFWIKATAAECEDLVANPTSEKVTAPEDRKVVE